MTVDGLTAFQCHYADDPQNEEMFVNEHLASGDCHFRSICPAFVRAFSSLISSSVRYELSAQQGVQPLRAASHVCDVRPAEAGRGKAGRGRSAESPRHRGAYTCTALLFHHVRLY